MAPFSLIRNSSLQILNAHDMYSHYDHYKGGVYCLNGSYLSQMSLAHIGCMSVCHCAKLDNRCALKHALIMTMIYSALSL